MTTTKRSERERFRQFENSVTLGKFSVSTPYRDYGARLAALWDSLTKVPTWRGAQLPTGPFTSFVTCSTRASDLAYGYPPGTRTSDLILRDCSKSDQHPPGRDPIRDADATPNSMSLKSPAFPARCKTIKGSEQVEDALGVSVVMATYNGASHISAQLATIAAQTHLPVELIISDDGSTDRTLDIVDQFAATAPFPIRVMRNKTRLGYGENFLVASEFAHGELVAFCDQDDLWREDKLAFASAALADTGADLFVHGAQLIDERGVTIADFSQGIKKREVLEPLQFGRPWSVFYGFSMVFRREMLSSLSRSQRGAHTFEHDATLSHDLWLYFLGTSLYRTVVDPEPLVHYRQHGGNATPHLTGAWFRRWTSSLGKAVDPNLPRQLIAYHRAEILADLALSSASARVADAASRAESYWRHVGDIENKRLAVYRGGRLSRARAWAAIAAAGGYSVNGLGWKLALKDALAGVAKFRRGS